MSAGVFTLSKYEADSGTVYSVRVQPETLAASVGGGANTAPTGNVTGEPSAMVGGSRRSIGVHCRGVRIRFTGAAPEGYKPQGVIFIPILTEARYDAITRGATGTYLGAAVEVVGKVPEVIR